MLVDQALAYTWGFLTLRITPFAIYAAAAGLSWPRLALLFAPFVLSVAMVARGGQLDRLTWLGIGVGYYFLVSLGIHCLALILHRPIIGLPRRVALYAVLFAFCTVLPAFLWPYPATLIFIALGWELALRGFSYVLERGKISPRPRLTDCLFFTLVDPTLFYPHRAVRSVASSSASTVVAAGAALFPFARLCLGLAFVVVNAICLRPLTNLLAGRFDSGPYYAMLMVGAVYMISLYVVHSGLAHFQLGALALCGWTARERYNWPLTASSPSEFWRRWNTYVGSWLEAYVFLPLAALAARYSVRWSAIAKRVFQTGALGGAFLVSGVLHDLHGLVTGRDNFHWTPVFVFAAIVASIWQLVAHTRSTSRESRTAAPWTQTLLRRFAMVSILAFGGALLRFQV